MATLKIANASPPVATYPVQIALQRLRSTPEQYRSQADLHNLVQAYTKGKSAQEVGAKEFETKMELSGLEREQKVGEAEAKRQFKKSETEKRLASEETVSGMRLSEMERKGEDAISLDRDILAAQGKESRMATIASLANLGLQGLKGKLAMNEIAKEEARDAAVLSLYQSALDVESRFAEMLGIEMGEIKSLYEKAYRGGGGK